jgi:hypothetical protein
VPEGCSGQKKQSWRNDSKVSFNAEKDKKTGEWKVVTTQKRNTKDTKIKTDQSIILTRHTFTLIEYHTQKGDGKDTKPQSFKKHVWVPLNCAPECKQFLVEYDPGLGVTTAMPLNTDHDIVTRVAVVKRKFNELPSPVKEDAIAFIEAEAERCIGKEKARLPCRGVRAPVDLEDRIRAWPRPGYADAGPQLCDEIREMMREYLALRWNTLSSGVADSPGEVILRLIFTHAVVFCIGIDWYASCDCLAQAVSDAYRFAEEFCKAFGKPECVEEFKIPPRSGLGRAAIEKKIAQFIADEACASKDRELCAVYLAGHAVERGGRIYMLPSYASSAAPPVKECIDVLGILVSIQEARKAEGNLLYVVDTCRSEPSYDGNNEAVSLSLVTQVVSKGTIACFAADRGSEASDGGLLDRLLPRLRTSSMLQAVTESTPVVVKNQFDSKIWLYPTPPDIPYMHASLWWLFLEVHMSWLLQRIGDSQDVAFPTARLLGSDGMNAYSSITSRAGCTIL